MLSSILFGLASILVMVGNIYVIGVHTWKKQSHWTKYKTLFIATGIIVARAYIGTVQADNPQYDTFISAIDITLGVSAIYVAGLGLWMLRIAWQLGNIGRSKKST